MYPPKNRLRMAANDTTKVNAAKKYFIHRKNAGNNPYFCRIIILIWLNIFINVKIGQILLGKMRL